MLEYWIDGMLGPWELKKYPALVLFSPLCQFFIISGIPPGFWILATAILIIILRLAVCAVDLAPPSEMAHEYSL
jgi:hypothetical protein